jgi:archaellum component FlaC
VSDRELVTIESQQFKTFEQRLGAVHGELQIIRERLGPVDKDRSIQQTLETGFVSLADVLTSSGGNGDIGNKLDQLFVQMSTLSNQQQLILDLIEDTDGPISNLIRKVETSMATQEERLRTIQGQMTSIADGINKLQAQLADLKVNNPELDDEISAIETTAKEIGEDLNPSTPAPTEPPV